VCLCVNRARLHVVCPFEYSVVMYACVCMCVLYACLCMRVCVAAHLFGMHSVVFASFVLCSNWAVFACSVEMYVCVCVVRAHLFLLFCHN
jgi:hypothetical protein